MESVMAAVGDTGDAKDRLEELAAERERLNAAARELIRQYGAGEIGADEYTRRYTEMDERHDRLQEERYELEETLYEAVSRKVQVKFYLDALKRQDGMLQEFDDALWRAVVESCVVNKDRITFTLKDGTRVE